MPSPHRDFWRKRGLDRHHSAGHTFGRLRVFLNASSGAGQTFSFVFSDTQSSSDLTTMAMLFSTSGSLSNSCYIVYDSCRGIRSGFLATMHKGSGSKLVGSTTVLQNSQCAVWDGFHEFFPACPKS